jgi:Flp pilus assembly protein TadG
MALVTPLLLALVFGIIEFGWMFAVRNAMTNAAREGARTGTLQGRDAADVEARVRDYLTGIGLDQEVTVTVTEPTPADPTVRVQVSVPRSQVSLVGFFFGYTGGTVETDCSMRKEGM